MNIYKCILCILLWKNLQPRNRFDSRKLRSFWHHERRLRFVYFRMHFDMHLLDQYQSYWILSSRNDGYIVIHLNRYNCHPVLKRKVMKYDLYLWLDELHVGCQYLLMKILKQKFLFLRSFSHLPYGNISFFELMVIQWIKNESMMET
jgi:hypothetical protein